MTLGLEIWQLSPLYFTVIWDIDLIFGMSVYSHKLQINFEIHLLFLFLCLLLKELKRGETFASLLNIHDVDISVVPTHLVCFYVWSLLDIVIYYNWQLYKFIMHIVLKKHLSRHIISLFAKDN